MPDEDCDHPANYCHQQHNFMKRWICVCVNFFWSSDLKQCKKLREGNLRRNMQCLLERRIYLDVKSDREGFELTFIKLLGMDICLFQTRIMKLNSTFKFKFSRVGEGGKQFWNRVVIKVLFQQLRNFVDNAKHVLLGEALLFQNWWFFGNRWGAGGNFLLLKNHLL